MALLVIMALGIVLLAAVIHLASKRAKEMRDEIPAGRHTNLWIAIHVALLAGVVILWLNPIFIDLTGYYFAIHHHARWTPAELQDLENVFKITIPASRKSLHAYFAERGPNHEHRIMFIKLVLTKSAAEDFVNSTWLAKNPRYASRSQYYVEGYPRWFKAPYADFEGCELSPHASSLLVDEYHELDVRCERETEGGLSCFYLATTIDSTATIRNAMLPYRFEEMWYYFPGQDHHHKYERSEP
jgi:hypothetical protein